MGVHVSGTLLTHDQFKAWELEWFGTGRSYQSWVSNFLKEFESQHSGKNLSTTEKNNYAVLLFENGRVSRAQEVIQAAWRDMFSGTSGTGTVRAIGKNLVRLMAMGIDDSTVLESPPHSPDDELDFPGAFIGATGNSGTTLLQKVLDDHPDINSFGETYLFGYPLFVSFCNHVHRLDPELRLKTVNELKRYFLTGYFQNPPRDVFEHQWGLCQFFSLKEIRKQFRFLDEIVDCSERKDVLVQMRNFLAGLFSNLTREKNARVWIEKTPKNLLQVGLIQELFPNCAFVQIYRDPRDVLCSRVRHVTDPPYIDDEESIRFIDTGWTNWMLNGCKKIGQTPLTHYVSFPYESFVHEPEPYLRRVSAVLGVDFSDAMLETEFRTSSIGRYQDELGKKGIEVMEHRFGELFELMGYEVEATSLKRTENVLNDYFDEDESLFACMGGFLDTVHRAAHGDTGKKPEISSLSGIIEYLEKIKENPDDFRELQVKRAERIGARLQKTVEQPK